MWFEIRNLNLDSPFFEEVGESTRVLGFKGEEGREFLAQGCGVAKWKGWGRPCYLCDFFGLVFNLGECLGWF